MSPIRQRSPVEIFVAYSHRDNKSWQELKRHISPLERRGDLATWQYQEILPGDDWDVEIQKHLRTAQVILLLISDYFLSSDYCVNEEMKTALERDIAEEAHVIPIILNHCLWKVLIGTRQALPDGGKPVTGWRPRARAFTNIAAGIQRVVEQVAAGEPDSRKYKGPYDEELSSQDKIEYLEEDYIVPTAVNVNVTNTRDRLQAYRELAYGDTTNWMPWEARPRGPSTEHFWTWWKKLHSLVEHLDDKDQSELLWILDMGSKGIRKEDQGEFRQTYNGLRRRAREKASSPESEEK